MDITLHQLDEALLQQLLEAAISDADPLEVMPAIEGPKGWTVQRQLAFLRFHQTRSLSDRPVETTYAIREEGNVIGAARLAPITGTVASVEAGIWLGRSYRSMGRGSAVFGQLVEVARDLGARRMFASTTASNAPMRRLLTALGAAVSVEDGEVSAWLDLSERRRFRG
ncbi:GNAT family N-acetyltransferase [Nonomuraea sp. NPDC050790]|uniref:GNAT family N-acetyltransferase n=1 Tax=Nonomuraea sp. NPDC050790 TaxID=3364371 RepID=UPI0037B760A5